MSKDTYRITSPTLSMRVVPKGSIITIESEAFDGNKLIEVSLEGQTVMMFTQDLRARAEKVDPAA